MQNKGAKFGPAARKDFLLEDGIVFLNHGSYGAAPKVVYDQRLSYLLETERQPDRSIRYDLEPQWLKNINAISEVVGSKAENLVFVHNTTTGINAVLRSLPLKPGEAILCYTYQYHAVLNTCHYVARLKDAQVLTVDIRPPILSSQEVVDKYDKFLSEHPNVKIAVLDYISSMPAMMMPIKKLIEVCKKHGIMAAIDAAHVPGQVQLNLEEMGADFVVGNLHKWMYVPRGAAILWVHPRHQDMVRPCVTSSHLDDPLFYKDFMWQGTQDDTPYHCVTSALKYIDGLGGLDAVIEHNTALADQAADLLVDMFGTKKFDIPSDMQAPCMRMVRLPDLKNFPPTPEDPSDPKTTFSDMEKLFKYILDRFNIQCVTVSVHGEPWTRVSLQIYNSLEDVRKLGEAILTLKEEEEEGK